MNPGKLPLLLLFFTLLLLPPPGLAAPLPPYQALLVADSHLSRFDSQGRIIAGNHLLSDLIGLFKIWSIPFQVIDPSSINFDDQLLLDDNGHPKYGTIIWCGAKKRLGRSLSSSELETLLKIAAQGTGFVDPGGFLLDFPELHPTLWKTKAQAAKPFRIRQPDPHLNPNHFISKNNLPPPWTEEIFSFRHHLIANPSQTLAQVGGQPILVHGQTGNGRHVLLRPASNQSYRRNPGLAKLLRRSILWSMGYGLFRHYPSTVMLRMDDPGAANPLYLEKWNFPSLTRAQVEQALLAPLRKYQAHADIFMTPGTVLLPTDPKKPVTVQEAWTVPPLIDRYGNRQDFPALWQGISQGVSEGLLSFQSHGLTHVVLVDTRAEGHRDGPGSTAQPQLAREGLGQLVQQGGRHDMQGFAT